MVVTAVTHASQRSLSRFPSVDVDGLRFTTIASEERLCALAAFDWSAYGEKDVPLDVLRTWWDAFPHGIRVAESPDGRILGAMSAWPLEAPAYEAVANGTLTEDRLTPEHFALSQRSRPRWYISGIAAGPELRSAPARLVSFLADGLVALGHASCCDEPDICAVATSADGERMLRRFGFTRRGTTPHGVAYERRAFRDARIAALAVRLAPA